MSKSQPGADAMPPRPRPHPIYLLLLLLALLLPLTQRTSAPLFAADLRLPKASWSFDMRVGPVQFRTGAFEIEQSPLGRTVCA
jgi:hypothetical protein